jgi:pimeloyl-ACP methyl ester carboxylesterase
MTARCGVRIESAIVLLAAMLFLLLGAPSAGAQCLQSECTDEIKADGTIYRVCVPEAGCRNGGLVVFAHGYVGPDEPLQVPEYVLGDQTLPELVNQLGFLYATSSFPKNGLAIQEAIPDLEELATDVVDTYGLWGPVILAGASEGGAITALAVERSDVFWGGLALCGPVGSFQEQINHYGHFRVVFDYFFPGILPGSAIDPDPEGLVGPPYPPVRQFWDTWYVPRIGLALQANPAATAQLLKVTGIKTDPADPVTSIGEAVVGNLWYNVFATYDAVDTLGGQPFDNRWKWYRGSSNDFRLNLRVPRYRADYVARLEIAANYETSGQIDVPVVTAHTTGDPIVPYWHEPLYHLKTWRAGNGRLHTNLPVFRYGHCEFTANEAVAAFAILLAKMQVHAP